MDIIQTVHVVITEWLRPEVVASYSGLYEECDVEHINVFGLVS